MLHQLLCFAGIFRDHIKYLLVLTTPLDVVMLGVSFAEDGMLTYSSSDC